MHVCYRLEGRLSRCCLQTHCMEHMAEEATPMYVCRRLHGSSQMTTEWSLGIRILKRLQLYCRPLSRLTTCHALWFSATIRVIQVSMPLREMC